jgi:site-specific recombinase XerD
MNLSVCIRRFFAEYLTDMKGVSACTISTYRDAFRLLLPFAANYHRIKISSLEIEHLSFEMVLSFLNHLERDRRNTAGTRNNRLAAIKSLAGMICLVYSDHREIAERIIGIRKKRSHKPLIGYLTHNEAMKVFDAVDLKRQEGFRDYVILHLLYDSGARASEIAGLTLEDLDAESKRLTLLGKGNRYRVVELWPKTVQLLEKYIAGHRKPPLMPYGNILFTNQRRKPLTRFGIHRVCLRHLKKVLPEKRLKALNPVHSFRHACAVNMLQTGYALTDIKLRLGHSKLESTMTYLNLGISVRKDIQEEFIDHTTSAMKNDKKLDELIDWGNKNDILTWLDAL